MNPSPEAAPQFRIVGPERRTLTDEDQDEFLEVVRQNRNRIGVFEGEIKKSNELARTIFSIEDALVDICKEAGIKVRQRLPRLENYHFFKDKEPYERALKSLRLPSNGYYGVGSMSHGIFIRENDRSLAEGSVIAHELGHFIGAARIESRGGFKAGYSPQWPLWEEITSDFIALEVETRRRSPVITLAYEFATIIGDAALVETAEAHNIPMTQLSALVIREKLTGQQTGLRLMADALGAPRMRTLFSIDYNQLSAGYYTDKALEVGLEGAAENIQAAVENRPVHLQFSVAPEPSAQLS